jgi:hypothetical protein
VKRFDLLIKNFGLIEKANINVRPLTIFLGENNTGKSYVAQLIYGLTMAISDMREPLLRYAHPAYRRFVLSKGYDEGTIRDFSRLLPTGWEQAIADGRGMTFEVPFGDLPEIIASECEDVVGSGLVSVKKYLETELKEAYGVRISELNTKLKPGSNFEFRIRSKNPILSMAFGADGNHLGQRKIVFSCEGIKIKVNVSRFYSRHILRAEELSEKDFIKWLIFLTISSSVDVFANVFPKKGYYFPAARSGILQGQRLIARAGLKSLKRAGIDAMSMSKLPGVVVDFLDQIYSIDKDMVGDFRDLSRNIERRLTAGAIGIREKKEELPEIYFRAKEAGRFPLYRTSSMVSELAPIILMLRYLIERDDIIILEEPESHLHPELQREFARIIANFVRNGIVVLITTHSDYFVEQLGNIIALGFKEGNVRSKLGYGKGDIIHKNEVGAYRFMHGKDGFTVVRGLQTDQSGISDTGFGDVAESLYDESVEAKRSKS